MKAVAAAAAAATLIAAALLTLTWQMAVDSPLIAYEALAIDRWGLVPYRDLYDFNTPGSYAASIAIGSIFGYSELGFRVADLTCLALLSVLTAITLRRIDTRASVVAPIVFGFTYLGFGPAMSLQREYLLLLPLAAALAAVTSERVPAIAQAAIAGLAIGVAATIKPQAAIVTPAFVVWAWWNEPRVSKRIALIGVMTLAVLLPVGAALTWLRSTGGLDAFTDIATYYWPLYGELTGARPHHIVSGSELWWYRLDRFAFSRDLRHLVWIPAIAGAWLALRDSSGDARRRRTIALLAAVAVALELYPLAGGKYWGYHWLPSFYGAALLAALCFTRLPSAPRDFGAAMMVVLLTAQAPGLQRLWNESRMGSAHPLAATANTIAAELRPRLLPGDRIQPLDWTGGVVHAMFLTETRIATPFLYDFYFYHHVSTPYIQSLRARFMSDLEQAKPAFVVSADQERRFEGPGTTYQFVELSDWLRQHYRAIVANERFVIYERNDHVSPRPQS